MLNRFFSKKVKKYFEMSNKICIFAKKRNKQVSFIAKINILSKRENGALFDVNVDVWLFCYLFSCCFLFINAPSRLFNIKYP